MQHVLRTPPAFGVLRRKRDETRRRTITTAVTESRQFVEALAALVVRGIPATLQRRPVAVNAGIKEEQRLGGAFEGGDEELSFLDDVSTAIPHVEVRLCIPRLRAMLGVFCCCACNNIY